MRIVFLTLLGTFLLLSLVGLALPERARIEGSLSIAATPAEIHALVDDFEAWPKWHPMFADPAHAGLRIEYGESSAGVGGQMLLQLGTHFAALFTIVVSKSTSGVEIELRSGPQTVDLWRGEGVFSLESIRLTPDGAGTQVTWTQIGAKSSLAMERVLQALLVRRRIRTQIEAALQGLAAEVTGTEVVPE